MGVIYTMYCHNCGFKLMDNVKFCPNCGTKVLVFDGAVENKNNVNEATIGSAVVDIADSMITLPITVNNTITLDESLLVYAHEFHEIEEYVVKKEQRIRKIGDSLQSFDDIIEKQAPIFVDEVQNIMNYIFEKKLLAEGIDDISITVFEEDIEEAMENYLAPLIQAQNTIRAYEYELGIEAESGPVWSGGGFGISGAIKGAIKAEALNIGTDIAKGLFKTITGTTDTDKINKLKAKLFKELQKKDCVADAAYSIGIDMFCKVYSILIKAGRRMSIKGYDKKSALAKYKNTIRMNKNGMKNAEECLQAFCQCLELDPIEKEYYRVLYRIDSSSRANLLQIYTDGKATALLEQVFLEEDLKEKVNEILEFTDDKYVLINFQAVAFDQEELDKIIASKKWTDKNEVFLMGGSFRIPLDIYNIHYCGYGDVEVVIDSKIVLDFSRLNISFENIAFDTKYQDIVQKMEAFLSFYSNTSVDNLENGIDSIKELAEQGSYDACTMLGFLYKEGCVKGIEKDEFKSRKFYHDGSEGATLAFLIIGNSYKYGVFGCQKDLKRAREVYMKIADLDFIEKKFQCLACYELADCFIIDYPNKAEAEQIALKYFTKAYNMGSYRALYRRALIGEKINYADLENAAKHDVYEAAYELGKAYVSGNLGEKTYDDFSKAYTYYEQAAKYEYVPAWYELGMLNIEGKGCISSQRIAANYFRKAAEKKFAPAQVELGICYANGEGVQQDYTQAVHWYTLASEQGNIDGFYNLGVCCYYGAGVDVDKVKAEKYIRIAAEGGNKDAEEDLEKLF